jgi:hypothetical protein
MLMDFVILGSLLWFGVCLGYVWVDAGINKTYLNEFVGKWVIR